MTYNHQNRTINVEQDSDAIIDLGPFFMNMLKTMAEEKFAPPSLIDEWIIIEDWLGSKGRALNDDDNNKIIDAWQSFIAKGNSPSLKLQPSFDFFSQMAKEEKWELVDIPQEVEELFRRQIATKEEREEKDIHDFEPMKDVLGSLKKKKVSPKESARLSKNRKIFISMTILWSVWVVARTVTDFEILGIYFNDWDEDMFFVNLLLPPLALMTLSYMYKWINKNEGV